MSDVPLERDPVVERHLDSALRAAFQPAPAAAAASMPTELPRERASYRILDEIGRGGMGVILRGRDNELARDVAVKILREDLAGDAATLRRFTEEAQIGGQLQHPGIVPIHEFGRMQDGRPYFAMKLIQGRTFAELLAESGTRTQARHRFLTIFEAVCQAIAYAHSRGVVHRDLKPANVMVGSFGEVQVVDWGLAKVLARPEEALHTEVRDPDLVPSSHSLPGQVMGTPAYMPPEQARGLVERIDERSDVFALGAILCEILTGGPPYTGDSAAVRAAAAEGSLAGALARLDALPGEEAELLALCKRCLAREQDARPRNAAEVAQAIAAHLSSLEERTRSAQIAAAEARVRAADERKARRLTLALALSLVLTMLIGAGAWLWAQQSKVRRQSQTAERVNAALDQATLAYGQASSSTDLARWREALAHVERAQVLLDGGEPSAGLESRVHELAGRIRAEADSALRRADLARANREFQARLQDLRTPGGVGADVTDWSRVAADYGAAFREQGLDPATRPADEVAGTLRARGIGADVAPALDEWAAACRLTGAADLAQRLTQVAVASDPDETRSRLRSTLARGDTAALVAISTGPDWESLPPATLNLLGSALVGAGAEPDALRVLRVAQQRRPDDFVCNVHLARLFWDHDYHEAARCYAAALALRPEDPMVIHEFGWLLDHYLLDPPRAIALFRRGLERRPDDPSLHLYLGHALCHQHELDAAIAAYTETLRLEPGRHTADLGLLDCYMLKGDLEARIAKAREILARHDNSAAAWFHLGDSLIERGDLDGAEAALRTSAELWTGNSVPHEGLRRVFEAGGDGEAALAEAREVLRLEPEHLLPYFDLGFRPAELVDVELAAEARRELVRQRPTSPTHHAILAILLQDRGHYAESLFELRTALELGADPANFTTPTENGFGWLLAVIRTGRPARTWLADAERLAGIERRFERVAQGEEQAADAAEWSEFALLALRRGRTAAAAEMFAKASGERRIEAAAAAASAGCGRGDDAARLGPEERARWRGQAADWMRADLELRARQAASAEPGERIQATRALVRWRHDAGLACVRDAQGLEALAPGERAQWRALWAEADAIGQRIRGAARAR